MEKIRQILQSRTLTLYLTGELDHHRAKEMMVEIKQTIDETLPKTLVLDLSGVTFSDSSGIAVLLRASRAMTQLEGTLTIVNVPPQPCRLFQAAGLGNLLHISQEPCCNIGEGWE